MKKNPKQIAAAAALILIALLIIAFAVFAFTASPGDGGNRFMGLLLCVISIPLLSWIVLFCVGRMRGKHTIAEFFPENKQKEEDI